MNTPSVDDTAKLPGPAGVWSILTRGAALFPRVAGRALPVYAIIAVIGMFELAVSPQVQRAALAERLLLEFLAALCVTFLAADAWLGRAPVLSAALERVRPALSLRALLLTIWIGAWAAALSLLGGAAAELAGRPFLRSLGMLAALIYLAGRIAVVYVLLLEDAAPREALERGAGLMLAGGWRGRLASVGRAAVLLAAALAAGVIVGFMSRGMQEFRVQYAYSRFQWAFYGLSYLSILLEQLAAVLAFTWFVGFYFDLRARRDSGA